MQPSPAEQYVKRNKAIKKREHRYDINIGTPVSFINILCRRRLIQYLKMT